MCLALRTHFNYEQTSKSELSFRKGDIFHVVDTLNMGVVGAWQVFRIGEPGTPRNSPIVGLVAGRHGSSVWMDVLRMVSCQCF